MMDAVEREKVVHRFEEEEDCFESLKAAVAHYFPPTETPAFLEKVDEMKERLPMLKACRSWDDQQLLFWLKEAFPQWNRFEVINLAMAMRATGWKGSPQRSPKRQSAWPVLVDDFVDSLYRKPTTSSCNLDQHFTCDGEMDVSGSSSMGHAEGIKPLETRLKAPILNKRCRSDSRSEASEAESVDCIAQRLAEMSSPLSCKRVRTSSVHIPETVDANANQDTEPEYMGLPEEADAKNLMNLQISTRVRETPVDNRHGVSHHDLM